MLITYSGKLSVQKRLGLSIMKLYTSMLVTKMEPSREGAMPLFSILNEFSVGEDVVDCRCVDL